MSSIEEALVQGRVVLAPGEDVKKPPGEDLAGGGVVRGRGILVSRGIAIEPRPI